MTGNLQSALNQLGIDHIDRMLSTATHGLTAQITSHQYGIAVLKLYQSAQEAQAALAVWRVPGQTVFPSLHAHDLEQRWLLFEFVQPGRSLCEEDDDQATQIFSDIIKNIQTTTTPDASWASLPNLMQALAPDTHKTLDAHISQRLLDRAWQVGSDLLRSANESRLLHGDCHHNNILQSSNKNWLMIDPKGYWGEFEFELGCFLRNPIQRLSAHYNLGKLTRRRLAILQERLSVDSHRAGAWAFVQAVLAATYAVSDEILDLSRYFIYCAEHFLDWT